MKNSLRLATLCFLSFLVTAVWIDRSTGIPRLGPLAEKLDYFASQKDDFELIFIGSSRIYRGIIPTIFDTELQTSGQAIRSFNFGMSGMGPHEANAVLRQILASNPERLRWVVIELGAWDAEIRPENRFKHRAIFWHDGPETLSAWHSTWLSNFDLGYKLDLTLTHFLHCGGRYTALGRGPDGVGKLWRAFGADRMDRDPQPVPDGGFRPFSKSAYGHPTTHPARRYFLARQAHYQAAIAQLSAGNHRQDALNDFNRRAHEEQTAMVRAHGAEPIYLIPPTSQATPSLYRLAADLREETTQDSQNNRFWFYNDPRLYPELYRVEDRFDFEHLAQDAAERFTRLLAARFVPLER